MSGLETIVRPFQDRQIAPAVLILDDTKIDDPIVQSIGDFGGTTFDYSYNFSGVSKNKPGDAWKETSRKSETVRITNPDDSEQFVDSKRATEINFNDTATGKNKRSYKYSYPDSVDTTKSVTG